ncbi:MAG: beta-propeller fold lactonase family protein, partial [Candidatus Binataceae bacterium]
TLALVNSVASLGTNGPGQPRGIVVDPTGDFVYVTDSAGGVVSVFSVDTGNALTFLAGYPTAAATRKTFDLALANNAAALFLYATNDTINTVSDFIVSSGVLSLQSAAGGLGSPEGIVSDPSGSFVYVANNATGQVFGYEVGAAGVLSSIGTFDTENPANPVSFPAFLAITQ